MVSFRSRHFPSSNNALLITQEYAMRYYALFNVILMLGILVKVASGDLGLSLLWPVLIGEAIAVGLGNLLAVAKLKRSYAEIFFVEEHFSLLSVYEILHGRDYQAFPMVYAAPALDPDGEKLTIHYHDQVVTLYRQDWEEFDLVCDWLFSRQL
jgi:hypothetical protein